MKQRWSPKSLSNNKSEMAFANKLKTWILTYWSPTYHKLQMNSLLQEGFYFPLISMINPLIVFLTMLLLVRCFFSCLLGLIFDWFHERLHLFVYFLNLHYHSNKIPKKKSQSGHKLHSIMDRPLFDYIVRFRTIIVFGWNLANHGDKRSMKKGNQRIYRREYKSRTPKIWRQEISEQVPNVSEVLGAIFQFLRNKHHLPAWRCRQTINGDSSQLLGTTTQPLVCIAQSEAAWMI